MCKKWTFYETVFLNKLSFVFIVFLTVVSTSVVIAEASGTTGFSHTGEDGVEEVIVTAPCKRLLSGGCDVGDTNSTHQSQIHYSRVRIPAEAKQAGGGSRAGGWIKNKLFGDKAAHRARSTQLKTTYSKNRKECQSRVATLHNLTCQKQSEECQERKLDQACKAGNKSHGKFGQLEAGAQKKMAGLAQKLAGKLQIPVSEMLKDISATGYRGGGCGPAWHVAHLNCEFPMVSLGGKATKALNVIGKVASAGQAVAGLAGKSLNDLCKAMTTLSGAGVTVAMLARAKCMRSINRCKRLCHAEKFRFCELYEASQKQCAGAHTTCRKPCLATPASVATSPCLGCQPAHTQMKRYACIVEHINEMSRQCSALKSITVGMMRDIIQLITTLQSAKTCFNKTGGRGFNADIDPLKCRQMGGVPYRDETTGDQRCKFRDLVSGEGRCPPYGQPLSCNEPCPETGEKPEGCCSADSDCGDGKRCNEEGSCVDADEGACNPACDEDTEVCKDEVCKKICDAETPCEEEQTCEEGVCVDKEVCDPACENGKVCKDGDCKKICDAETPCEEEQTCEEGVCVDKEVCDPACENGKVCKDGDCKKICDAETLCEEEQTCEEGVCVDKEVCDPVCDEDTEVCKAGDCKTICDAETPCEEEQTCEEGVCVDKEVCDPACGDGKVCKDGACVNDGDGTCDPVCSDADKVCKNRECVVRVCESDSDCSESQVCRSGECKTPCDTAGDCSAEQICEQGVCKNPETLCDCQNEKIPCSQKCNGICLEESQNCSCEGDGECTAPQKCVLGVGGQKICSDDDGSGVCPNGEIVACDRPCPAPHSGVFPVNCRACDGGSDCLGRQICNRGVCVEDAVIVSTGIGGGGTPDMEGLTDAPIFTDGLGTGSDKPNKSSNNSQNQNKALPKGKGFSWSGIGSKLGSLLGMGSSGGLNKAGGGGVAKGASKDGKAVKNSAAGSSKGKGVGGGGFGNYGAVSGGSSPLAGWPAGGKAEDLKKKKGFGKMGAGAKVHRIGGVQQDIFKAVSRRYKKIYQLRQ